MVPYGDNYHPKRINISGLLHPYVYLNSGIRFANGDTFVNNGKAQQPANYRGPAVVNVPYCSPFR
jgi:hypothetical protein